MTSSFFLSLLGLGAVGAFAVCDICQPAAEWAGGTIPAGAVASAIRAPAVESRIVTLMVEGMTCGGCAIAARKVLERLDGVTKAEVSYEQERAVVTYDPERVTIEQMIAAVKKLGYTATVVATS